MSGWYTAILVVLLGLPPFHSETDESAEGRQARLQTVAAAIDHAAAAHAHRWPPQKTAAALLALGWHESRFARYVGEGRCHEGPPGARCDPNRHGVRQARTYWQLHRVACPAAWALPEGSAAELQVAARCAAGLLIGAEHRCRHRTPYGLLAGAFSGYRGIACDWRPSRARAQSALDFQRRLAVAKGP